MEILKDFGIEPILVAAQVVNFLVILYILKRFLYKPLFAIFQKREELVQENLKNVEESKKALANAEKEEAELIKKAQKTASQIVSDAKEQSTTIINSAQVTAKKQTESMIEEARAQITRETQEAEKQLTKHISDLSLGILKKSLAGVFTPNEQEEIVKKAMKAIQKPN